MQQQRPVRCAVTVPAGDEGEWRYRVRSKSMIRKMRIFFPPGSGGDLHVTPIYLDTFGNTLPLLHVGDESDDEPDDYLSGDNLARDYSPLFVAQESGWLLVEYDNQDLADAHWFEIVFELEELME